MANVEARLPSDFQQACRWLLAFLEHSGLAGRLPYPHVELISIYRQLSLGERELFRDVIVALLDEFAGGGRALDIDSSTELLLLTELVFPEAPRCQEIIDLLLAYLEGDDSVETKLPALGVLQGLGFLGNASFWQRQYSRLGPRAAAPVMDALAKLSSRQGKGLALCSSWLSQTALSESHIVDLLAETLPCILDEVQPIDALDFINTLAIAASPQLLSALEHLCESEGLEWSSKRRGEPKTHAARESRLDPRGWSQTIREVGRSHDSEGFKRTLSHISQQSSTDRAWRLVAETVLRLREEGEGSWLFLARQVKNADRWNYLEKYSDMTLGDLLYLEEEGAPSDGNALSLELVGQYADGAW